MSVLKGPVVNQSRCAGALVVQTVALAAIACTPSARNASDASERTRTGPTHAMDFRDLFAGRLIIGQIPLWAEPQDKGAVTIAASGEPLPAGSRIITIDPAQPESTVKNLTPGFAAAGRPDISFDGKRILFIGKKAPEDRFVVWEMNADGDGRRQVTHRTADALQAVYLSTVFLADSERPEERIAFLEPLRPGSPASLHTCHIDGTDAVQITYNPYGVYDPLLLSDGRLLYSSSRGPDAETGEAGGSALFTVFPDGADVSIFEGGDTVGEGSSRNQADDRERSRSDEATERRSDEGKNLEKRRHGPITATHRGMPCETSDGRVVYVESPVGQDRSGGMLVSADRRRSLHTRRVVSVDARRFYRSPKPVGDNLLMASSRPIDGGSYGVVLVDATTGQRVAEVFDDPVWHDVDAALLEARPAPAGRSSAVNRSSETGWLYCMNAYETDLANPKSESRIARVQVMVPEAAAGGPAGDRQVRPPPQHGTGQAFEESLRERLLGEAPVESDGSFYVELPAGIPVRLKTLDDKGDVLQAMRSWIWVMPREARGCIGCHEDREMTPPNRHVLALRRAATRIGMDAMGTVPSEQRTAPQDNSE